jgi:hypothetical protein
MKTIRFFTFTFLNSKLPFVSFGFCYFLVVFERISFYFHFVQSDVRIKQDVSFRYRNELKIRPKKQIGFVHVDITSQETKWKATQWANSFLCFERRTRNGTVLLFSDNLRHFFVRMSL